MKKSIKSKKGFTLTEMILVVAVIVIMAGVLIISAGELLSRTKNKSDDIENSRMSISASVSVNDARLAAEGFAANPYPTASSAAAT